MSASKLTDLLPIPVGVSQPNAFQVFGLTSGEDDPEKIKAAVRSVYQRLKQYKTDSDPEIWKAAAQLASKAKAVLEDPAQRARVAASANNTAHAKKTSAKPAPPPAADPPPPPAAAIDPLAGVLPTSDPLAALLPNSNPLQTVAPPPAAAMAGVPAAAMAGVDESGASPGTTMGSPTPAAEPTSDSANVIAGVGPGGADEAALQAVAPVASSPANLGVRANKRSRKRKKKSWAGVLLGTVVLGLFGAIGGMLYFLYAYPPGNANEATDAPSSIVNAPIAQQEREPKEPRDQVLGEVAASGRASMFDGSGPNARDSAPNARGSGLQGPGMGNQPLTGIESVSENDDPDAPMETDLAASDSMPAMQDAGPSNSNPDMDSVAMNPSEPQTVDPEPAPPTPEEIEESELAITQVSQLIRQGKWAEMKSAAEKLTQRGLTDQQSTRADALYHIADLASYYRGGIQKGLGTLKTASTFEIANGLNVIVVEADSESLTIMFDKKNRSYTLDDMPFRIAEKLASFAMPDTPDSTAAKVLYQSIAKKSTAEYRNDAISVLRGLDGQLETVDVAAVIQMLGVLYPEN